MSQATKQSQKSIARQSIGWNRDARIYGRIQKMLIRINPNIEVAEAGNLFNDIDPSCKKVNLLNLFNYLFIVVILF